MKRNLTAAAAIVAALMLPAQANNIVDEWASIKTPAAPTLKPVTVDPKTTALLMLDFMNQNCGKRPRCLDTIPAMKKLLDTHARQATVVWLIANTTAADVIRTCGGGEARHRFSRAGQFLKTDLEKILMTRAQTSLPVALVQWPVLYTASGAALRGMNVIIPVDGMSAVDPYSEYSTVFTFMNAPSVSAKTTLTKSDMIKF
jgi:nicotinamidase-related amidase